MSSDSSVFGLPLHGTCPHCKHFHKNWEFPLPSSGGRVKCARCEKDMFGLGRADTQYTLASVDSIPLSLLGMNAAASREGCSDVLQPHSEISAPMPPDGSTQQSQPILTGRQPAASSGSQDHGAETYPTETQLNTPTDNDGSRSPIQLISSIYIGVLQRLPYHQKLVGASDYVNTLGTRLAAGLPQTPREYSIFGWRFVIHPPNNHADRSAAIAAVQQPHFTATGNAQANSLMMSGPFDRANLSARSNPPPVALATDLAQATHSDNGTNVQTAEGHSNRLKQIRRERTLAKNALQQLKCRCTRDCHCIPRTAEPLTSDSEHGDAHSSRVRTPPRVDDIPSDPVVDRLGAQRFLYFSRWESSTESSGQSMATSQAPTLGSGSSVSLRPRPPRMAARSRSVPMRSSLAGTNPTLLI